MAEERAITVYTDGSCNPPTRIGAWAAMLLIEEEKILLTERVDSTTHQRMELTAVIKALEYLIVNNIQATCIAIYTDSQYVAELTKRRNKLQGSGFITKKKHPVRNTDLVKRLFEFLESFNVKFIKVKAHQSNGSEFNREVDIQSRKVIRDYIKANNVKA